MGPVGMGDVATMPADLTMVAAAWTPAVGLVDMARSGGVMRRASRGHAYARHDP